MNSILPILESLARILSDVRPSWHEKQFQQAIEKALIDCSVTYAREVPCEGGIVDFVIENEIAVEVKTAGTLAAAERQLSNYLKDERFNAGLLITTKPWKLSLTEAHGKPVRIITLWRNGL